MRGVGETDNSRKPAAERKEPSVIPAAEANVCDDRAAWSGMPFLYTRVRNRPGGAQRGMYSPPFWVAYTVSLDHMRLWAVMRLGMQGRRAVGIRMARLPTEQVFWHYCQAGISI